MKKAITCIFMMVMIVFGSFLMVACDKEGKGQAVYSLYNEQMTTIKEDESTPFVASNKNNITSDYFLRNFNKKEGTSVVDAGQQDEMIALALNYIEKYYPLTEQYGKTKNIQSIVDVMKKFEKSYNSLKSEYLNSKQVSQSEETIIYNGFMARYAEAARKFSIVAYDAALSLSNYINKYINPDKTLTENVPAEGAAEFFYDTRVLEIYNDFNDFVMQNGKGMVGSVDTKWFALQSRKADESFCGYFANEVINVFDSLADERENMQKALGKFSYYDYSVKYNNDIKAYGKALKGAQLYYGEINRYFLGENNYLDLVYDYLETYILEI